MRLFGEEPGKVALTLADGRWAICILPYLIPNYIACPPIRGEKDREICE